MRQKFRIGWREWVRLPDLGGAELRAKIDTGAKTSALHARRLKLEDRAGRTWASFDLLPDWPRKAPRRRVEAEVIAMRRVTSSNGAVELRPVVRTMIMIGGQSWAVQVTLTNRRGMSFAMLIGREALTGRVIIDPAQSYLTEERAPP